GMAAADALQGHPAPARGSIAFNRGDRIGRAARLVAAARWKDLRRSLLPALGDQDHQPGDHLRSPSRAFASSERIWPKSRSMPLARPIITWSEPAKPFVGTISRARARKRRFMRLRMTAPPILRVTVKPTRIAGSASCRSRTRRMKPGVVARLPALAARKSARFLIVLRR